MSYHMWCMSLLYVIYVRSCVMYVISYVMHVISCVKYVISYVMYVLSYVMYVTSGKSYMLAIYITAMFIIYVMTMTFVCTENDGQIF